MATKKNWNTFWVFSLTALFVGFVSYGIFSWAGVFDKQSTAHNFKTVTPSQGTYTCDSLEINNLQYNKRVHKTVIHSISVTCNDPESKKIKKYTFTRYDGLPKYIKGFDNYEGWWVNSIDILIDPVLEPGEETLIITTQRKPTKTNILILLPN